MTSDDPGTFQLLDAWHLTVPDPARSVAHLLPPALQGHVNLTAVSARYLAVVGAATADQLRRTAAASALDVPLLCPKWTVSHGARAKPGSGTPTSRPLLARPSPPMRTAIPIPGRTSGDELDDPSSQDLWLPRALGEHARNELCRDEGSG